MSIALVQHVSGDANNTATISVTIPAVTAGNTIVIVLGGTASVATSTTCSDSVNTVQTAAAPASAHSAAAAIYYIENATAGSHTVTANFASGSYATMLLSEWSGMPSSGVLDSVSLNANGFGTAITANSVTPAAANELAIVALGMNSASTPTWGAGLIDGEDAPAGALGPAYWGYEALASTSAFTASATIGASHGWVIYTALFKSAAGGGASGSGAVTEGADTVAGSGSIAVSGSAAISEAADVASGTGALGTSGAAAIAEGADTASGSGTAINGAAGSAAITEGADTVSGTGALAVSGAAAVHEGADAVSGSGNIAIGGSAAIAEGSDIAVGSGFIGSGIPMPNLIGVNYFEALQILQDAGIYIPLPAYAFAPPTVNVTWQKSALRGGIVTAQSLPAGAGAFAGEVITLTVSAFPFAAVIDAATGSQRVN